MTKTTENNTENAQETQKLSVDPRKRKYKFLVPTTKNELIKEVQKRWWYGMPMWPSPSENYSDLLSKNNLREVTFDNFINEPEIINGKQKVQKVEAYPGVYLNSKGKVIDLRDKETKPSFVNLKKKEIGELAKVLKNCLKNQIYALREAKEYEVNLDFALTKFLRKFKTNYASFFNK